MVNSLVVARSLGVSDFGRFSLFYVVSILAWQVPQGFDTAYLRFARNQPDQRTKDEYLAATVAWKVALSVVAVLAAVATMAWSRRTPGADDYLVLIAKGILAGCLLSFSGTLAVVYQERGRFGRFSIVNHFTSMGFTLALVPLWLLDAMTLGNVIVAYTVACLLVGAVTLSLTLAGTGWLRGAQLRRCAEVFSFGKWVFGVTFGVYVFQRLDLLVAGRMLSFADVGVYGVAVQVALMVSLFTGSIGAVLMPQAMAATGSRASLRNYAATAGWPIGAMAAGIALLAALSGAVVSVLYGREFLAAVEPLRILLIGWAVSACFLPFSYLYYGLGVPQIRFALELVKLVVVGVALPLLVPRLGVTGAAWSTTTALVADVLLSGAVLTWVLRGRLGTAATAEAGPRDVVDGGAT